jgi:phenylacetate-CoA ligase
MDYEQTRHQHLAHLASIFPEHLARVTWPVEKLKTERERGLRDLLRVALAKSPWHRGRLHGVDPDRFAEKDLARLPSMTKTDLMANWDDIVSDRRLTLEHVQQHVAGLTTDAYLFDHFHAVASGGSSGSRGVFAFGWEGWALAYIGTARMGLWDRSITPEFTAASFKVATVAAHNAAHMTSALAQTFSNPWIQVARFPVTEPIEDIVAGLNDYQPLVLAGYPSALSLLAAEARTERLRIVPRRIVSTAEPLPRHVRSSIEQAFGAPVANTWGISEAGAMATGCFRGPGMHLCDDLLIVEPVDSNGLPVPIGTRSDKILVTTIANPTLPLIRYEISDQMTFMSGPCPCGSSHQLIADVEGRIEDVFSYSGGAVVHPRAFDSELDREAGLVEYQVWQTPDGADIKVLGTLAAPAAIQRALELQLTRLGVADATVRLQTVGHFERLASGKVRRFIPLT